MNLVNLIRENQIVRPIYSWLTKVLEVVPYFVYLEGVGSDSPVEYKPRLSNCSVVFLDESDIKAIAAHSEVEESEKVLISRIENGCKCLGVKEGNVVAAYTWCNLKKCQYENRLCFELMEDEAYLFDARTFNCYRGKSLAPYLRRQLYLKLNEMGRSRFYSTTSIFNTSAKQFKKKLNAQILKLYLYIGLFKKIKMNVVLKQY